MEATNAINAAIVIIIQASAELVASGQPALADPGTPLPAVIAPVLPSVANNPAAGVTPGGQPGAASITPGGSPGNPIVTPKPVSTTRGPINRRQNLINHYLAKTV